MKTNRANNEDYYEGKKKALMEVCRLIETKMQATIVPGQGETETIQALTSRVSKKGSISAYRWVLQQIGNKLMRLEENYDKQ